MSLLKLRDLHTEIRTRERTVRAVAGVTLDVEAGETVGLVGESGSGKSMIANSVVRLLPPGGVITGGSIVFNGVDLVHLDSKSMRNVRGNDIGFVFQDPMSGLNPTMTIGHQIAEALTFHKNVSRHAARRRAREVLELVSVPQAARRLDDYPHQLSGGLRQRVMIAMALACSPRLLIADEPTTALDVTIQAQILSLLDELRAELNMAMLLITHDFGVVAERSDRVAVMYAGKIVEEARTEQLFGRIAHPYTAALLASIPRLDQDRAERLYSIPGSPPDLSTRGAGCAFEPRCQHAQPRCGLEEPQLTELSPSHSAACFFPLGIPADPRRPGELRPTSERASKGGPMLQPARASLIDICGISRTFPVLSPGLVRRKLGDVHALTDVSLHVAAGETVGIVGESGCGKTTLGKIVATLDSPSAGRVHFDGTDLSGMREADLRRYRRHIQLIFQDPFSSLDPRMRVGSIIREPLVWQRVGTKQEQRQRVFDLLGQVGLPRRAVDHYPHEFSGGQRQRIAIARALALYPRVIVADEPVSALDVSIRSQVLNLMKDLQREYGLTYLIISHDLSVVRYIADRIAVMYLGKIVEIGTGDDIYARAAHHYTAGLLSCIPVPAPRHPGAGRMILRGELPSPTDPPSGCRFRLRCERAEARCSEEVPQLRLIDGVHEVACHFPIRQEAAVSSQ